MENKFEMIKGIKIVVPEESYAYLYYRQEEVFNHEAHKQLWRWKADNIYKSFQMWPHWENYGITYGHMYGGVFACLYAMYVGTREKMLTYPIKEKCILCPFDWSKRGYIICPMNTLGCKNVFGKGETPTEEQLVSIYKDIIDLPLKEGVKCGKMVYGFLEKERKYEEWKQKEVVRLRKVDNELVTKDTYLYCGNFEREVEEVVTNEEGSEKMNELRVDPKDSERLNLCADKKVNPLVLWLIHKHGMNSERLQWELEEALRNYLSGALGIEEILYKWGLASTRENKQNFLGIFTAKTVSIKIEDAREMKVSFKWSVTPAAIE